MFSLRNPEWFALIPIFVIAGWYWRGLQLQRPLRLLILVLGLLVLCRPQWLRQVDGLDLFVLLDRSASTEDKVAQNLPEWQKLLESGKRNSQDRLVFVDYATDVLPQSVGGNQPFTGNRNLTRTNFAIQNALALRDEDRPARLLLFTDGYSTEPMAGVGEKLARENVPLDVRFIQEIRKADFQLTRLRIPPRVLSGEPFMIDFEVTGPKDGPLSLQILRDGQMLKQTEVKVRRGRGSLRFTDRLREPGARKYEVMLLPLAGTDAHAGNNRMEAWTEVQGGPRVLLVTAYDADPMAQALQSQGYAVEVVSKPATLTMGNLAGAKAIILNNVAAYDLPAEFLKSIPFFVQEQGGGLLMVGGKKSFGSGGYFHSAIDPVLPVSMELKTDQRKTAVTLAIVMDRSGSMGAGVAGGRVKMDLANEGAAEAVKLLGNQDSIAVLAVDSEIHEAVKLQEIGTEANRQTIEQLCRRISVGGGGIFTYTGLKGGWDAIKDTNTGTRHIILFADASDAEEPGDYLNLLADVTKAGGSVSVIAMGNKTDSDAKFLEDVADKGKGRIFFATKPEEIPIIFTQETVAIARSAFVTDPTGAAPTGGWLEMSNKNLPWPKQVDAYNLSYKQNWASQALVTQDEYSAPLIAWGHRGAGRTAAVSFPLGGPKSETARAWTQYGDFVQTLTRWLMGEPLPPGLGLKHDLRGTELQLNLLFDDKWTETFNNQAPRIVLAEGDASENKRELTWERLMPGQFHLKTDLLEGQVVRGVIQAGKNTLPFGPLIVGSGVEWMFSGERVEEVLQTATTSGGRELLDIGQAWVSPPTKNWLELRFPLLIGLLLLILSDALLTRMGWRLPEFTSKRPARVPAPTPAVAQGSTVPAVAAPALPEEKAPPTEEDAPTSQRQSRFAKAKRKFDDS